MKGEDKLNLPVFYKCTGNGKASLRIHGSINALPWDIEDLRIVIIFLRLQFGAEELQVEGHGYLSAEELPDE